MRHVEAVGLLCRLRDTVFKTHKTPFMVFELFGHIEFVGSLGQGLGDTGYLLIDMFRHALLKVGKIRLAGKLCGLLRNGRSDELFEIGKLFFVRHS